MRIFTIMFYLFSFLGLCFADGNLDVKPIETNIYKKMCPIKNLDEKDIAYLLAGEDLKITLPNKVEGVFKCISGKSNLKNSSHFKIQDASKHEIKKGHNGVLFIYENEEGKEVKILWKDLQFIGTDDDTKELEKKLGKQIKFKKIPVSRFAINNASPNTQLDLQPVIQTQPSPTQIIQEPPLIIESKVHHF